MSNDVRFDESDEIAIISMACRFPGAGDVAEFWENLRNGVESVTFFSDEELITSGVNPAALDQPSYVKAAAVLEGAELFDAPFFSLTRKEAEITDPQHRLMLECAWQALESAGYDPERYEGLIGVFTGMSTSRYNAQVSGNTELMKSLGPLQIKIGNDKDFLATRISYKLNLKGPSLNVQTACSTSLVAVHLARQSLLHGECDMALAGGVSITVPQRIGYLYQEGGIASPDGHCRAFDVKAEGTLAGHGAGMVLLKRLADAWKDGDSIEAIIKGSAINNDGSSKIGYTAPGVDGQAEVIAEALATAQINPETVTYIEAHGTATPLGDPIEIAALTQAFRQSTGKKGFCAVGSVKTNIGHLDAAAGVAGLIKTVLALKHRMQPPSLHFEQPNPQIDFANSPFYVNHTLTEWKTGEQAARRAGVSSFGIGGTNAHVVLEEAPTVESSGSSRPWQLLLLSAKTGTALETATSNLIQYLKQHPQLNLADVAHTLQVGRRAFQHRRALVCRDLDDALAALEAPDQRRVLSSRVEPKNPPCVFMFPGQGTQHVNMGGELYRDEATFREDVSRCSYLLRPHLGFALCDLLYPVSEERAERAAQQLTQTSLAQPALFVIEYALANLLMRWGVRPQAMIGHSIGEYVAACLAGVFTLEDALAVVADRGRLMQQLPNGAMLAVPLSENEVEPFLAKHPKLSLAAINGAARCVVSGPTAALDELEGELARREIQGRRLHTSHAFHSSMMEPVLAAFTARMSRINLKPPQIPYVSNLTGTWVTTEQATDPHYWSQHLRRTVRFAEGVGELLKVPERILLEIGPGQTLCTLVRQHQLKAADHIPPSTLLAANAQSPDMASLLKTLAQLWLAGQQVNWNSFYARERRRRVPLPTYPFERERYWTEASSSREWPSTGAQANDIEGGLADALDQIAMRPEPVTLTTGPALERFIEGQLQLMSRQLELLHEGALIEEEEVSESRHQQDSTAKAFPLTPIQQLFFEQNLSEPNHWNQSVLLETPPALDPILLGAVLDGLAAHHESVRLRFVRESSGLTQFYEDAETGVPVANVDLSQRSEMELGLAIESAATRLQTSLDIFAGPVMRAALFHTGNGKPDRLLLVIHHLAVDVTSWRILLEDLQTAYRQLASGQPIELPAKTTPFKRWAEHLHDYAQSVEISGELERWLAMFRRLNRQPSVDSGTSANTMASTRAVAVALSVEETEALLADAPRICQAMMSDVLLMSIAQSFAEQTGNRSLLIDVEGHGREGIFEDVDLSRTVGWFTAIYPLLLELPEAQRLVEVLRSVREQIRSLPNGGIGYGLLRYMSSDPVAAGKLSALPVAELCFNYLGRTDRAGSQSPQPSLWRTASESRGPERSAQENRRYLIEATGSIVKDQLRVELIYSENFHQQSIIEGLAQGIIRVLKSLIGDFRRVQMKGSSPSIQYSEFHVKELGNLSTSSHE